MRFALALALVACKNEPTPPTEVPVPDCADPTAALLDVDVPTANAIYSDCLVGQPNDPELLMGQALTAVFLLHDDPAMTGLITSCGEEPVDNTRVFGADGLMAHLEASLAGDVTITTAELVGGGAVELFPEGDPIVEAWSSSWRASIDVGDDLRWKNALYVDVSDERWDPVALMNVPNQVGDAVDLTNYGADLRVRGPCNGGRCRWDSDEDGATGTVTLVATDWSGGRVELAFDATLVEASGGPSLRIVGTAADTPYETELLEDDFPIVDAFDASRCDTDDCHWSTESLTRLVEVCPGLTADEVWSRGRDLGVRLSTIAAGLEAAGADPDARFVFPADALPMLFADLAFNQTDALMLAAHLRAVAAHVALASSYDLIEPTATGQSRIGDYTRSFTDYDGNGDEFCADASYWGLDEADLNAELIAHAGELRADEQLAEVRTQLTHAMEDLKAALQATPGQDGFLDATGDRLTADEVIADIDVVLASLGGQDGALASVPAYQVTLDAFFANPLTRASVTTAIGTDPLVLDPGTCTPWLTGDEAFADWLPENNGVFPVTGDLLDANGAPGWFSAYETYRYDVDGLPRFASGTLEDLDGAYGQSYYDAP